MVMDVKVSGLNGLKRRLKRMEARARHLHGQHKIRFDDLFDPGFMRRYTGLAA